eukprot:CAMPEP_0181345032 /NCGR_PEP_ID=MMETSP1101-20121128/32524_1 /TAXON_ID=46948 /ORGANISM="Rhodomonas abbreviata, Strain Caron Lab Isolate" /LENGTH=94 /DNA_ID=CAMNT_0023456943 /DNA_START=507 /DNA_END=791 /DNA_ORIENTATION=-
MTLMSDEQGTVHQVGHILVDISAAVEQVWMFLVQSQHSLFWDCEEPLEQPRQQQRYEVTRASNAQSVVFVWHGRNFRKYPVGSRQSRSSTTAAH